MCFFVVASFVVVIWARQTIIQTTFKIRPPSQRFWLFSCVNSQRTQFGYLYQTIMHINLKKKCVHDHFVSHCFFYSQVFCAMQKSMKKLRLMYIYLYSIRFSKSLNKVFNLFLFIEVPFFFSLHLPLGTFSNFRRNVSASQMSWCWERNSRKERENAGLPKCVTRNSL